DQNRQLRVELAMRKFATAKSMVESPTNKAQWDHLHPMANGLLTAAIYKDGVMEYEQGATEPTEKDYAWMIAQVMQSPALNAGRREKDLSDAGKRALLYAQMGNEVIQKIKKEKDQKDKSIP